MSNEGQSRLQATIEELVEIDKGHKIRILTMKGIITKQKIAQETSEMRILELKTALEQALALLEDSDISPALYEAIKKV